ncbi:hypothetical protein A3I57_02555 [Candidatus Beckwithbacteria bacterium RIFCSPLOWO2_02_FULL_47_23]|uniref:Uncharacterized protein n=1 Tax=Candidatus Beckwithbacteria bacterium RIFCSPLOWO2_02_FULL_47_23 TaxID=1797463 RepID=A0A1F5E2A4_9BACT|nr:MAG: hypothetical protein A3I57_02555 [Candidatus Beckwithbacteria bacterium RIFCSPLOWO2_02_FULL_47_23]
MIFKRSAENIFLFFIPINRFEAIKADRNAEMAPAHRVAGRIGNDDSQTGQPIASAQVFPDFFSNLMRVVWPQNIVLVAV